VQAFSERPPYLGFVLGILECAKVFFSIVVRVQAFSERPPYQACSVSSRPRLWSGRYRWLI